MVLPHATNTTAFFAGAFLGAYTVFYVWISNALGLQNWVYAALFVPPVVVGLLFVAGPQNTEPVAEGRLGNRLSGDSALLRRLMLGFIGLAFGYVMSLTLQRVLS